MDQARDALVSLFRIVVGMLFACHGAATLFGVLGGPHGGAAPRFAQWPDWWAAAIEFGAGGLVTLGLVPRVAALLCSGSMAYAYFTVHQPKSLFPMVNGGEPAVMFCWSFLMIALIGGGSWSLGRFIARSGRPATGLRAGESLRVGSGDQAV